MGDNIGIGIEASGDDGVNRITSAIDRLNESMVRLGENSAVGRLAQQMELMQATMVTGFANIASTTEKLIESMGSRQVAAVEGASAKTVSAMEEAGLKMKEADARTWDQIQRGSAANVTRAFSQLAQGIPVEAVEQRFGRMAASAAASLDGQLAQLRQFQENAKSLFTTEYKPMAGATEAQLQEAAAMNARFDAARAASRQAADEASAARSFQNFLDIEARKEVAEAARAAKTLQLAESSEAQSFRNFLELEAKKEAAAAALAARTRQLTESAEAASFQNFLDLEGRKEAAAAATAARTRQLTESAAAASFQNFLDLEAKKEAAEAARAARTRQLTEAAEAASFQNFLDIEAKKEAAAATLAARTRQLSEAAEAASFMTFLDIEAKKEAAEAARIARMRHLTEAADAASFQNFLDLEAKKAAATERIRALNTNFLTASPAAQVHTAQQAQVYSQLGGDATAKYGSAAAATDALAAAQLRLSAAERESAASALASGTAHIELDGALRQVEGAFRGAAHQAGIYGFHHGQLIALLAGGAVAAGLHHIAETGAEVEFQLASLNALSGEMAPIDVNKFIGITAGSMTSLKDAAEGAHALAQAGQDQKAAFAALPDVMRLASLGEMSVAQASEMAVESMHAFGKEITDLGAIGDILVAVGAKSNLSVHKLAEDMKSAAVTGALFNLDMKEITATVGALAERGLTIMPLSSALNKLYEPSAKTAKVMKEWHLSVKDGEGNLKNYTQFMGELADKVNEFRVPADALKGLGMSPQSIKAMEVMTQHFDAYKHLLHEADDAEGKMFSAMTAKEDTVEGSWKRLASTVEGSLVGAFENASPIIRAVEEQMMHMAGSEGFQHTLEAIATGVARLTQTVVGSLGPLSMMAGAYIGLRVISAVTTWISEMVIVQRAQAAATLASTAAISSQTVQLDLFAVAENAAAAGGARVATSLDLVAIGARGLTAAFGWLSLIVVGVTAAVDLFGGAMEKSDRDHLKQQNSFDNTTDAVQREIDRLKGLEDQLRKTGETGTAAAAQVAIGFAQMEEARAKADLDQAKLARPKVSNTTSMTMVAGLAPVMSADEIARRAAVDTAQVAFDKAHAQTLKAMNLFAELDARSESVKTLTQVSTLKHKVEELPEEVKPLEKTEAARQAAEYANESLRALKGQEITEGNVVEMSKLYAEVQKDIAATKREITAAGKGDKDAAREAIELLQEQLRLKQMDAKSELDNLKSQNKRGQLGDLQLINRELATKLALDQAAIDIAKKERAAAGPLNAAQRAKFDGKVLTAEKQVTVDKSGAARASADLVARMDTEELQHRSKTLESRGQLEDAFNLSWEAKYRNTLSNLDLDIADAENGRYRDGLIRYRDYLEELRKEGQADSIFKMDVADFDKQLSEMRTKLSALDAHNGPGTGLDSHVAGIFDRKSLLESSLPSLQESYAVAKADAGDDPVKLKAADNMLKQIQSQAAELRNIFVGLGQTISQSLTEAFGKSGTAMGGLITTAANYDAKMRDIQAALDESDGGAAAQQRAAADKSSTQVKAYGDMTSAAKGFFDTNSHGYKILHAAEQAFRIYELSMAVGNAARKIFLEGAVSTAVVSAESVKSGAILAGTETQLAADTVKGTSAAAVAVATQASGDPYTAWIRMAAMAAAMASLGFAVMGGVGGSSSDSKKRQEENGTGTIAGDSKAKSDSIARSLDLVSKNTYNNLNVSLGMLAALQSIQANISNFAGLLVQNENIANPGTQLNTNNGLASTAMTGGMGAIGYMAGAGLSAFTSMAALAGPLGLVAGLLISKIPVFGKIATAIFGGKQSLQDSGFSMNATTLGALAAGGAHAQTYADVTTSGGWFRSDKHDTKTTDLSVEANRAITQVVMSMGDTIKAAGAALGVSGSDFESNLNNFVVDLGKISLKDLSSSEQQAAIQTAFSKLGDQMASAAFSTITQFSKAGEGALETLARVATDYQAVDVVFKSFGTAFYSVGMESIAAREHLIDLAGGLDKFTSQASYLFENFLTKAQQLAATHASVDPTLAKYGLSSTGADAAANFAKVTIAMGAMGEAGAQAYTELMNVAPAFKTIVDAAREMQDQIDDLLLTQAQKDAAARAALDPDNQKLFDQLQQAKLISAAKDDIVTAYERESQAMQSAIDRLKSFSANLKSFVVTLGQGNLSPLNPADKYGAALSLFNETLAKAEGGDVKAQDSLTSVAQDFLTASRAANASNSTYMSDYNRVLTAVSNMSTVADKQVSEGQANLAALHEQVSRLVSIDAGVMSVATAINNLASIMAKGTPNQAITDTTGISALYQELLHRTPDAAGLAYWVDQMKTQNLTLVQVADLIKRGYEYVGNLATGVAPTSGQSITPSTQYGTAPILNIPSVADATPVDPAISALTNLYQQLLHRAPDQAGLDYWLDQVHNGMSLSEVGREIQGDTEYQNPAQYTADPYAEATQQNAQILAAMAAVTAQISGLRQDQAEQHDEALEATMTAGAKTGNEVADAIKTTNQAQAWSANNTVTLR